MTDEPVWSGPPEFRKDLYRGTAPYYDRYRLPYPIALWADLRERVPISGSGRLLDVGCGTGQIALPLAADFAEVVAVDQEPETVAFGRAKADGLGVTNMRWLVGSAETVVVDGTFELVAFGNAFHRLDRPLVAARIVRWLQPGGAVAVAWGGGPSAVGDQPWQLTLRDLLSEWITRAGTADLVPAGWQATMESDPDDAVLRRAGLKYEGKFEFEMEQEWTIEALIGFAYSTSVHSRRALGGKTSQFEADLTERLSPFLIDGVLRERGTFAYELARQPFSAST